MSFKKRSWSFTTAADGTGSLEIGLGARYARIFELVVDDSSSVSTPAYTITDNRGAVLFVSDAQDVSEGPLYNPIGSTAGDVSDDNEAVVAGVIAEGPVTISCTGGGNALVNAGSIIVEV